MPSNSFWQPSRAQISPGTRLNGIYEIDNLIGVGGMGEIYKGHNIETGDLVAIKLMLPDLKENDAAMALFRKEASALHSLNHEAIVRYYVFTVEPVLQRPYLAMEFVEGQPLSERLKKGPLTLDAAYALKYRVAMGLQAAHERGVIHRDVSPDNIIIPNDDVSQAKIIDFGIARSTQRGEGTIIGGGFAGKYNYVSPEQLGLFGGNVTGRSDIYSLGLLLAEALTGQPINMGGSQVEVIEKRRKVPDLGAIDMRVRPLIEKMLQPDPEKRPESMAVVAAWQVGAARPVDLRRDADSRRDYRSASPASAPRSSGRGWKVALAASVAVVLLGGGGAGYYYLMQPAGPAVAPPPPPLKPVASLSPSEPGSPATLQPSPTPVVVPSSTSQPPASLTPPPPAPNLAETPKPNSTTTLPPSPPVARLDTPTRPSPPAPPTITPTPPPTLTPPPAASTTPSVPKLESPPDVTPIPPVASLTPAPTPAPSPPVTPPAALGPVEKITRFINDYQGGDCFFVAPVRVSANTAKIEGYGGSIAPFNALDAAFKSANGFEADIGVRQVTSAQCPAITFLHKNRNNTGATLRLRIGEDNLKSGQALTGTIDGYGDRQVELLLVSDEGSVLNVSRLLKPAASGKTFNLRMQRNGAAGAQPQLLIAVATSKRLETLEPRGAVEADLFFPLVTGEASRSGQTIAAAATYFKLDQ